MSEIAVQPLRERTLRTIGAAASVVLGAAFCFAAVAKSYSPAGAEEFVARFLHPQSIRAVVMFAVATELVLGCWLLSGFSTRWAALSAGALLLGFSVALYFAFHNRAWTGCGCMGRFGADSLQSALARNTTLFGLSLCSLCLDTPRQRKETPDVISSPA